MNRNKIPPRSPWGLIQEDLYPNEWLILVSCILLNCTSRKQVEKVFPEFIARYNKPSSLLQADEDTVRNTIASLGFKNRRTKRLYDLAIWLTTKDWKDSRELPGVGEYGARAVKSFAETNSEKQNPMTVH